MLAACAAARFRAISSWCPPVDLVARHKETPAKATHIEKCYGGKPRFSPEVDREYRERSPLFHAAQMTGANLSIHHGRFDRMVPYTHTLRMAGALEKLSARNLFYEIFDGGHECHCDVAFRWFEKLAAPGSVYGGEFCQRLTR